MLILASASPRRKELLQLITEDFTICTKETDESLVPNTTPALGVECLALRKAQAVFQDHPLDWVIGADTVVALDGALLGKPRDAQDAQKMLLSLSGRRHSVFTGVALLHPDGQEIFSQETTVTFAPMDREEIERYVASGEPMDKAGAYGIQGKGSLFVAEIAGDYYNVMGLPVARLYRLLKQLGWPI